MAVSTGLTAALKKVVLDLEDDLRDRVASQPDVLATWKQEHKAAETRERTAMSWQEWRDDRVTQAAVAWVLTTVFVRFCEDNRLLKPVWIAGPADRRQEALDAELAYFRAHPEDTDREWVLHAVEYLRNTKATRDLVESHSPLWTVSPSGQAAKRLIAFWRERTADGDLVWNFADRDLSTRFLGDLYQDLSDYAKSTFALLQTPEFVEEFILDQTMEPALDERPLEGFKLIDPTCGSGHFLLGAFVRLKDLWATHAPGMEVQARVQKALDAIHGVDLNPFAVAIARFRLMVAALQAASLTSLEYAPAFQFQLAAGDSLLHGRAQLALDLPGMEDYDSGLSGFAYATEDLAALRSILEPGQYDVVVGNPPYIPVRDKKLNAAYRELYSTCKGTYALTVPFMERFFQLARPTLGDRQGGWVGQITSNSFMKREFGSRLIEDFLSKQDLRLVVDTSGAYIPGHGTPTVIIVGRHQAASTDTVRAVLGIRGEPGQPDIPGEGLVWTEIVKNIGKGEYDQGGFVSVTRLPRTVLATHPWSLAGGGVSALAQKITDAKSQVLGEVILDLGRTTKVGGDDAWYYPSLRTVHRYGRNVDARPIMQGEAVRDYVAGANSFALWPYADDRANQSVAHDSDVVSLLWPHRTVLRRRLIFGETLEDKKRPWFDHLESYPKRLGGLSIAFAFVATHNQFALDRDSKLAASTAPVIKLPEGATEDDHLALLGVLNSSTACFWLKQNSHNKGNGGIGGGIGDESWEPRYEFTGTTLEDFPLCAVLPVDRARSLDRLAQGAAMRFGSVMASTSRAPSEDLVRDLRSDDDASRSQMIAEQEDLDWKVYWLYGIIDEDLTSSLEELPHLSLGERAFEIALARKVAAGDESTQWFARHGSTPITEIPTRWPQGYRELVQRRLDLIESNKFINLLERPECKRRWATEPWEKRVEKALRAWLLDRLEAHTYWFDAQGRPTVRSIAQLADIVTRDSDLVSVLQLWDGRKDRSVTQQLSTLLDTESVPFLAAYRLKDSGLRKREAWEHTWDLQRREDEGEKVGEIPVPPKYTSADFRKQSWWQHRGKLDVPKERFILYPNAGRETDPTQLLGWAGWDHAQQALALNAVIAEREAEGWADDKLVPLVAGLAELQPWVRQWHDETDSTYQLNLADYLEEQLRGRAHQVGMTVEQLGAWRPPAASRGRRPRS
ncbi:BREX-2 system adenine-specific DNA-methyltransferase PglX [Verrucosispora sp. WMMC514]|uniref:BREX-2 system adenine-specific DNA-methyltransferase PglX n=1 Tax=Verrucosispora sp. WMMC514 TaxID=3015156 RepID=UPI00248B0D5D|nr:BREX-2 system adenine-specific DNA-methyltransferase PglX [Verrucosispora sp. WMMC514]WBB91555.1 BREX-2 system adenine-specific DNA-methyltransferase PglX [Verrucosispora sp. WMMC514]